MTAPAALSRPSQEELSTMLRDGVVPSSGGENNNEYCCDNTSVLIGNSGAPRRTSCLLRQPKDEAFLSDTFCFLRRHVEAFVVAEDGVDSGGKVGLGRVGVRCAHCARWQGPGRVRGGVFFPSSTRLVYQAVRNVQRYHFQACEAIPKNVKEEFISVKKGTERSRSSTNAPKYWEECCQKMGMYDAADGIRLRTGYFDSVEGCKPALSVSEHLAQGVMDATDSSRLVVANASSYKMITPSDGRETNEKLPSLSADNAKLPSLPADPPTAGRALLRSTAAKDRSETETCSPPLHALCLDGGGDNESSTGQDATSSPQFKKNKCCRCAAITAAYGGGSRKTSCLLQQHNDPIFLSELFCFVRQHVEAFVDAEDGTITSVKYDKARQPTERSGRVGMRCVHCARLQGQTRLSTGTVIFPGSIQLVYQAVRKWQFHHILSCPSIPEDVKAEYISLKSRKRVRSKKEAPKYWEECCRRMGMVDTADRIRLRTGCFEDMSCGEFSCFDESTAIETAGSTKRSGVATASVCSISSGEKGSLAGLSQNNEPDRSCNVPIAAAGAEVESGAGVYDPSVDPLYSGGEKETGREQTTAEDNVQEQHGTSSLSTRNQTVAMPETLPEISEASSSAAERSAVTAAHFGSLYTHSEMPNHYVTSAQPSDSTFQDIDYDDIFEDTSDYGILPGPVSNEEVLEKVRLALNLTEAVGQIRRFPLVLPSSTEEVAEGAFDAFQLEHQSQQSDDLSFLGSELYELLSGRSPYEDDNDSDIEERELLVAKDTGREGGGRCQQRKRDKRRDTPEYIPLSELGFPPTICSLVSSLLDPKRSCIHYDSVTEVGKDLRLMVSKPEKFLFPATTGNLQISHDVVYGRDKETKKLIEAFDRMTDQAITWTDRVNPHSKEMILLSGFAGTGKSVLVENVRSLFIARGACFVSGKYDVMQQLQPFSAIFSAVNDYCDFLANDMNRIKEVRDAITSVIGIEGRAVLASLIPRFNTIVSSSDNRVNTACADGSEVLRCLIFAIRLLFRSTCSRAHPVVLFLDNFQRADSFSLELLKALMADTMIEGMLFIGCYRDNEVGADHPLTLLLADIRDMGSINTTSISIGNLDIESTKTLLSDLLHVTPQMTKSLAEVVLQKTGGNALFAKQFLGSLYDERLLYFSLSSRRWEWDISKIRDRCIADNVVEFMTAKLQRLSSEVLEALKIAAAFGAQSQDCLLQIIGRAPESVGSITAALDIAVAEGIMCKDGSSYRFAHDQIHQAAYFTIPESKRAAFHLRLGRLLWKWCNQDEMETLLFTLVDQLHRGSSLIMDHDEKIKLARLSLLAAEMASAMSAFLPALAFLTGGIDMLDGEDWENNRTLCFDLFNQKVETAYILGDFDAMQDHLDEVLMRKRTIQEALQSHLILVRSTYARGGAMDAINIASTCLAQLGEGLPPIETEATVNKQEIIMTERLLLNETEDSLSQMETMENAEKQEAMKYLSLVCMFSAAQVTAFLHVPVCRMVCLSVLHGVCRDSAYGFACYGMILSGVLGKHSEGYRFGTIALSLLDRFQAMEQLAKVYLAVYVAIKPWSEPIQACLPPLKRAIDVGLATGDVQHALICAHTYAGIALTSGQALGPLMDEMRMQSKQMVEYNQSFLHTWSKPGRQTVLNLLGQSSDPTKLIGEELDEESLTSCLEVSNHVAFLAFSYRLWLEYLFGEYHRADKTREKSNNVKGTGSGLFCLFPALCNNVFYSCLTALALAREEGKAKHKEVIFETLDKMQEWAALAPWNCENKLTLMKAEYAFLEGDELLAVRLYDCAVDLAVKHRFVHEQALALERYGVFHLEMGNPAIAFDLLTRARDCYNRWGAVSKASHIEEKYL